MVREQRRVGAVQLERGQQAGVQLGAPVRGDPVLDGHPHELVAEPYGRAVGHQDPGLQALVHVLSGPGARAVQRRGEQAQADPAADDGGGLERPAAARRGPGHPRADRVPDGGRDRRPAGLQDLADVERVAAGHPVQLGGVHLARPGQRGDRRHRQRRQPHPPRRALGGQVAEHDPERVVHGQLVVTVGDQQQRRDPAEPPAEQAEQVNGGLVGPVHVLDHHDRERLWRGQLGQERGEQLIPRRAPAA